MHTKGVVKVKAKCVINFNVEDFLKIGKVYDVEDSQLGNRYYTLEDETGYINSYAKFRFQLLE